jgi:hypothetical protein
MLVNRELLIGTTHLIIVTDGSSGGFKVSPEQKESIFL